MRTLFILRGAPASGKTTFIREHKLESFTVSPDTIRRLVGGPVLNLDGKFQTSATEEALTWKLVRQALENRMRLGSMVVLDCTNTKTKDFGNYKGLAETYRYRVYCIDFSGVPKEELLRRNAARPDMDKVPNYVIDRMYSALQESEIPKWVTRVEPQDFDSVVYTKADYSKYNKVHVIGDVHGCYTVLMQYLGGELKEDELYIFLGDFTDRGIENAEMVKWLLQVYELPNVTLIEGNHEKWLKKWSHNEEIQSPEFDLVTRKRLEEAEISQKDVRQLCRRFCQCAYFEYKGKTFFVSHGGISTLPENLLHIPTAQMIGGVGKYEDSLACDDMFEHTAPANTYQIHGHRNIEDSSIQVNSRCFNLEGKVEYGGYLRCVQISDEGIVPVETLNTVFKKESDMVAMDNLSIEDVIEVLRKSDYICEKKLANNISSFNFTNDAFYDSKWNSCTMKARGLFINTVDKEIVARSYDKFFNFEEVASTRVPALQKKLVFPVTAYIKENGFLGIVSYDKAKDDLLIASKSTTKGEYRDYLEKVLKEYYSEDTLEEMKAICKNEHKSFIFECIDPVNDPHIIDHDYAKVVLLDVVDNTMYFRKLDYPELSALAKKLGLEVKRQYKTLNNWKELEEFMKEVQKDSFKIDGKFIEGFVFEDRYGFMFKLKLSYYKFWKYMREAMYAYKKYDYIGNRYKHNALSKTFCEWLEQFDPHKEKLTNICEMRRRFYEDKAN